MKNGRIHIMAVLLLTVLVQALGACTRRLLEDDYACTALIPVQIDWSVSGVPVEDMHRASVWLFPVNDGIPLQYHLEDDLIYREITVPVGVYSVLVFNETVDENDWNGITFTGTNQYNTFAARSVSETLVDNPEPLAAWSLDRFEVTQEMVIRTRTIARNHYTSRRTMLENEVPDLTVVKPLPRFEHVSIIACVTNLFAVRQVEGSIDGMAAGVYMVSGEKIAAPATHAFLLNGRVYADNGKDGTTVRTFNIFGRLPAPEQRHNMHLDFFLIDGTLYPREVFDVTPLMTVAPETIVRTHLIHVEYGHFVLPDLNVDDPVSVDGWEDEFIHILNFYQ